MTESSEKAAEVRMSRKYLDLVSLINKRLNHFPAHERQGLALMLRNKAYLISDYLIDAQKSWHKLTPINRLDTAHEQLRLRLSRSTIARISRGVNFVGYRTWRSKRFIRKHSLYKARKAVREGRLDSFISHLAHASRTHSLQHLLNYAMENNYGLYSQLPKKYHSRHYKNAQCA